MADPPRNLSQFAMAMMLLAGGIVPGRLGETLRGQGKSRADIEQMERGYYEHLLDDGRRLDSIGSASATPPPPPFKDGPLAIKVLDLRECVLVPGLIAEHQGATWSTNSLGLRDREYPTTKAPETRRILLLGDSIGVGWGVDDDNGFEPVLERSLGAAAVSSGGPAVELLNLSVPGYAPGQRREHLERLGWSLQPDAILFQATGADLAWDERRLRVLLPIGIGWNSPAYRPLLDRAGLRPGMDADLIKRRLRPLRWEILEGVYQALAADARRRGVPVVWVLLPRVGRPLAKAEREGLLTMARQAGFSAVLDLSDTFDGLDPQSLAIGPDDYHPNGLGHALIARRLEAALIDDLDLRPFWAGDPSAIHQQPSQPLGQRGRHAD
ncbi:hypothetical protein BH23PLA1_BH23PLA1_16840 [soil metagenome]